MIKVELDIAPYCEKCRRWSPEIKEFDTSTMGGEYSSINTVQCERKNRVCRNVPVSKGAERWISQNLTG